jgi:hypothetical protein
VDPRLREDWVEVRYDPFSPLETVTIYSEQGEYLGTGTRHEREGPVTQPDMTPSGQPRHNYIELLIQKHQQALDQARRDAPQRTIPEILFLLGRRRKITYQLDLFVAYV